ncbi:hypothetical protein ACFV2X_25365 [Streptomyces sp. NPDC059679]|uniref:hypothetical protein n=1 Tax=Streptomyces sp. NPDC059679 TaxID=3346903 RepID=UPI0036C4BFDB
MMLTLTCNHCHEAITAADEDELVTRVQTHVRGHAQEHGGGGHVPTREQILARLHHPRHVTKP